MYNYTTHAPTLGSMVLDADSSVHWRCIDAVKTLLCSSSSNSIYRCYIEDAIAICYSLGKCSHRNRDGQRVLVKTFSCRRSWTLNSTLTGIQDRIIMEETTLEGLQTLHVDTSELACTFARATHWNIVSACTRACQRRTGLRFDISSFDSILFDRPPLWNPSWWWMNQCEWVSSAPARVAI
jgi:hypothetical protein